MKIGAIFCSCAGQIAEKIDFEKIKLFVKDKIAWFEKFDLACSEETKKKIINLLALRKPDGLLILGCSPKNKESLFHSIAEQAGINPYMINFVNLREQVVWVTEKKEDALKKAYALFNGALERLKKQKPLFEKQFPFCDEVMIVGGGIAGLKAAVSLSKAGRKVYLIERENSLGGKITKYEKLFPALSCGPCVVHPMIEEVLNSDIELRLNSELKELKGFFGSLFAKVLSKPVYVNPQKCIGCGQCEEVCPVNAIRVEPMKLPAVARINPELCIALQGEDCNLCIKECPVPDTINFNERGKEENIKVGSVLWATGFELMDCKTIPQFGYGRFKDVYNAIEFEEILNSEGPTKGEILTSSGQSPQRIAIIHCVGSLDENFYPYCSKICCQYAFKFNRVIRQILPDVEIVHFFKEIVLPGKKAYKLYSQAIKDPLTRILRYESLNELKIDKEDSLIIYFKEYKILCDIVVLCPAIVSDKNLPELSGVFLAGSVKEPMTIEEAETDAMAQIGEILCLFKKKITKQPFIAQIDYNKCSRCGICLSQCPYKAIEIVEEKPEIIEVLCEGCGICVASCPSKAIDMEGYSEEQIYSEIDGILKAIEEVSYGSDFT
ncbi:heterodisulfide reductase subunit A [Thermodesulfovibrio aggregans]|uniref:Heterodisulfide reductase subunit A n=1 Tax=Thermodesulfovibrio aggregans TaxID=86166 RepID=A0A0U9HQC4_9BACT|nr:CoB--CoM heterodisulfide reductase iron-sulfur subunit A family protein [Thermodesulfovibrio aggregans]GAQ95028.1 heterodisulfide reductase subunit A [Thermodesulfovibrio aggregans]